MVTVTPLELVTSPGTTWRPVVEAADAVASFVAEAPTLKLFPKTWDDYQHAVSGHTCRSEYIRQRTMVVNNPNQRLFDVID